MKYCKNTSALWACLQPRPYMQSLQCRLWKSFTFMLLTSGAEKLVQHYGHAEELAADTGDSSQQFTGLSC